jgi:hypothetical protein
MPKYIIEGGVDFYGELYKSLDVVDDNATDETKCLITNMPLEEDYVKLKCGHKFNYIPLYNELKKQKKNCNVDNYHANKLLIKCPYCRSFQAELLPEKEGVKPIYSINSMNKNSADFYNYIPVGYFEGTCQIDPSNNGCSAVYVTKLDNGKCYCQAHKYFGMQMYLVELKQKAKEERAAKLLKVKQEKELVKQQEKEEKELAKQKAKEEKELAKQQEKQKAKEEKELAKQQEKQKAKEEKELAKQKAKEEKELVKQQEKQKAKEEKEFAKQKSK